MPDPAGAGWSPYAYAGNPLSYVDPDGRFPLLLAAILIGSALSSAVYAATTDNFTWQGLAGAAATGAIAGALAPFAPAGIIPGAIFGAGVGYTSNFVGAMIAGTDPYSAGLWGAAGGFVGGGLVGGLQAHVQGLNVWTGNAPKPILAPVPMSSQLSADDIPIRGRG